MNQDLFDTLPEQVKPFFGEGKVADYIPALSHIPTNKFGIAATTISSKTYKAGDASEQFSLQSISKVLALFIALQTIGDEIWDTVGRRLTTKSFNAITPLEEAGGTPRNPFTNAGALVMIDRLLSEHSDYPSKLIEFTKLLADNNSIQFDPVVAISEKKTGHRNIAIAHFLKSCGAILNSVDDILEAYFLQCSLAMNCIDLSKILLFLANKGVDPVSHQPIITPLQTRRINALMMMFGTYDAAGEFVFRIGLPAKSGVGGGLVAIVPGRMSIAVWSPSLDVFGTSVAGLKALEILTVEEELSVL
jgi:glutaminase